MVIQQVTTNKTAFDASMLYDVVQKFRPAGADSASIFQPNSANNPENAATDGKTSQYSKDAEQKIRENEIKNKAIFNQVVEQVSRQINDEVEKQAFVSKLKNKNMGPINVSATAANGGEIKALPSLYAGAVEVYISLFDEIPYKAIQDGKEVEKSTCILLQKDLKKEIPSTVLEDGLKDFIDEKDYIEAAKTIAAGESRVFERDSSGNPVITATKQKNGDITFVCKKVQTHSVITYSKEQLGQSKNPANKPETEQEAIDKTLMTNFNILS